MSAGRIWPAEWRDYRDLRTGVTVRQLTNYKGHSHHLYFTNSGWHDGGRRLLCASDRENRTNMFSLDLSNGEIFQLTDLAAPPSSRLRPHFQQACLNPGREEVYFCYHDRLMALDLVALELRVLWEITRGFRPTILIRFWRRDGAEFIGPRMLCEHDSSSHIQEVHVHPRLTPDAKGVLFTSDLSGYGNLYLVDLPEFDALPPVSTRREFSMARAGLR